MKILNEILFVLLFVTTSVQGNFEDLIIQSEGGSSPSVTSQALCLKGYKYMKNVSIFENSLKKARGFLEQLNQHPLSQERKEHEIIIISLSEERRKILQNMDVKDLWSLLCVAKKQDLFVANYNDDNLHIEIDEDTKHLFDIFYKDMGTFFYKEAFGAEFYHHGDPIKRCTKLGNILSLPLYKSKTQELLHYIKSMPHDKKEFYIHYLDTYLKNSDISIREIWKKCEVLGFGNLLKSAPHADEKQKPTMVFRKFLNEIGMYAPHLKELNFSSFTFSAFPEMDSKISALKSVALNLSLPSDDLLEEIIRFRNDYPHTKIILTNLSQNQRDDLKNIFSNVVIEVKK